MSLKLDEFGHVDSHVSIIGIQRNTIWASEERRGESCTKTRRALRAKSPDGFAFTLDEFALAHRSESEI